MGAVLAPPPEPCGTTAKTSEWERAAPKEGGAGALPHDSLRPGFLWKKAGGKNTRAPPWTRVFMAARSHSLGLGMVASGPFEVLFPPVY